MRPQILFPEGTAETLKSLVKRPATEDGTFLFLDNGRLKFN